MQEMQCDADDRKPYRDRSARSMEQEGRRWMEGMKVNAIELRNISNCPLQMCKAAIEYAIEHNGGETMALAYLKAKTIAVKTHCSFDERVQRFLDGDRNG